MIVKFKKARGSFITVSRSPIDDDDTISFRAKGVLTYLMGRPDTWKPHMVEIAKHGKDSVKMIRGAVDELKRAGYITITPVRSDGGVMLGWEWFVTDAPHPKQAAPESPYRAFGKNAENARYKGESPKVPIGHSVGVTESPYRAFGENTPKSPVSEGKRDISPKVPIGHYSNKESNKEENYYVVLGSSSSFSPHDFFVLKEKYQDISSEEITEEKLEGMFQKFPAQITKIEDIEKLLEYSKQQHAKKLLGYAYKCLTQGWTPHQCVVKMESENEDAGPLGMLGAALQDLIDARDRGMEAAL